MILEFIVLDTFFFVDMTPCFLAGHVESSGSNRDITMRSLAYTSLLQCHLLRLMLESL